MPLEKFVSNTFLIKNAACITNYCIILSKLQQLVPAYSCSTGTTKEALFTGKIMSQNIRIVPRISQGRSQNFLHTSAWTDFLASATITQFIVITAEICTANWTSGTILTRHTLSRPKLKQVASVFTTVIGLRTAAYITSFTTTSANTLSIRSA